MDSRAPEEPWSDPLSDTAGDLIGKIQEEFDVTEVSDAARLVEDLGLDSIQMIELVAMIEEMAQISTTPEDYPILLTVGDCIEYLTILTQQSVDG